MAAYFKSSFRAFGLVLVSTLVALAIGELVVRFWFPREPALLEDRLISSGAYGPDPVLGWRPQPNSTYHSVRFNVTYTTNSRGLRGPEQRLERSAGLKRIVVLGDSFAWGWGVNDDDVFPRVMAAQLRDTEVVNLGITAFAVPQEFDYLKIEGILYQPDIVVLALCQNDIPRDERSPQEIYRFWSTPQVHRTPSGFLGPLKV